MVYLLGLSFLGYGLLAWTILSRLWFTCSLKLLNYLAFQSVDFEVPDKAYSRNVSCDLMWISMFLDIELSWQYLLTWDMKYNISNVILIISSSDRCMESLLVSPYTRLLPSSTNHIYAVPGVIFTNAI